MAKIYSSVEELIGHTPLLRLSRLEKELGLKATLLAKLEYLNPAGSVKDRVALKMIEDAEKSGKPRAQICRIAEGLRALPPEIQNLTPLPRVAFLIGERKIFGNKRPKRGNIF